MKLLKLLLLLISINLNAQESRFKAGETLNVWAQSGLNMRDKPDAKAPKLTTIPYGAKVVIQPNIGVKIPFEVEEFKGFIVKGYWLLVKYGNTEGFVFDGFLSRLPAPKNYQSDENDGRLHSYLEKQFRKEGKQFDIKKCDERDWLNDTCEYTQRFNYGLIYTKITHPEVGGSLKIKIPNITLYEGYFLVKYYFFSEDTDKRIYESKTKVLNILPNDEGVGCHSSIFKEGNYVVIDNYCGC